MSMKRGIGAIPASFFYSPPFFCHLREGGASNQGNGLLKWIATSSLMTLLAMMNQGDAHEMFMSKRVWTGLPPSGEW